MMKEMAILRLIEKLGILRMNNYLMTLSQYPVRLYAATTPSTIGDVNNDPNHDNLYYPEYYSQIIIIVLILFSIIIPS